MSTRQVSLSLYRAMWRWSVTEPMRSARFAVPVEQLPLSVLASVEVDGERTLPSGRAGAQELIREAWRAKAALTDPTEIQQAIDGAFSCLRIMSEFQEELTGLVDRRAANADRRGISFHVGQVLRHRKYGYRGVIIGWDRRPQVDVSGWDGVQGLPSGPDQPFYNVLPDLSDCVELLGGPRDVRYVAQENLVEVAPLYRRISHPGLGQVLRAYDAPSGRFVPSDELGFEYPGSMPGPAAPPQPRPDEGEAARTLLRHLATTAQQLDTYVEAVAEQPLHRQADEEARQEEEEGRAGSGPSQLLGPGRHVMGDLRKLSRRARRVSARAVAGQSGAAEAAAAAVEAAEEAAEAAMAGEEVESAEAEAGWAVDPLRGCVGSLRQLTRLADFVSSNLAERQAKQDRSEISFHVGQVLRTLGNSTPLADLG